MHSQTLFAMYYLFLSSGGLELPNKSSSFRTIILGYVFMGKFMQMHVGGVQNNRSLMYLFAKIAGEVKTQLMLLQFLLPL